MEYIMNWIILILISAVFLSLRTIFTKKLLIKNETVPILFLISLFSSVFMIFFRDQINLNLSLINFDASAKASIT